MDSIFNKLLTGLKGYTGFFTVSRRNRESIIHLRWKGANNAFYIWIEGLAVTKYLFREAAIIFPVSSGKRE
jgi:hypothetical protein